MPLLRQSTAQVILFGPCLDKTDGLTEKTGLTLAQADMRLSKDGGAFAQKSAAGNATHDTDGWYNTTLSITDTATVGELILNIHQPANMLPVWLRWFVVEENIYDSWYAASAAAGTELTALQTDLNNGVDGLGALKTLLDAIPTTMRGTDNAALASVVGALADGAAADEVTSGDTLVQYTKQLINILIGTPGVATFKAEAAPASGVSLSEVIRAIHADVTGIAGSAMLTTAQVNTEVDNALNTAIPGGATANSINQRVLAIDDLTQGSGTGDLAAILADTGELQVDNVPGLISALNNITTAQVNTEVDIALRDINLDHIVGTASGIPAVPAGTYMDLMRDDGTAVFNRSTDSLQAIRDSLTTDVAAVKTETALIVADTNELQTDWKNTGRLDTILDARASQTTADAIETDTADIQGRIPTALLNSGRMDSTIDATGMESGAVSNILTTQMTESYAANGVAPTLAQAMFATHQMLMQFGISGTAYTVRKLDNSTTAFIVTLDDGTSPTDAKRV